MLIAKTPQNSNFNINVQKIFSQFNHKKCPNTLNVVQSAREISLVFSWQKLQFYKPNR